MKSVFSINKTAIIIAVLSIFFLNSCKKEDELSEREIIQERLENLIEEQNINFMFIYSDNGSNDAANSSWSFDNGFISIKQLTGNSTSVYDLNYLISYEYDQDENGRNSLILHF